MLVLSRKVGETILVDGGITIMVIRITGATVRLGIEAPDGINIVRSELTTPGAPDPQEPGPDAADAA